MIPSQLSDFAIKPYIIEKKAFSITFLTDRQICAIDLFLSTMYHVLIHITSMKSRGDWSAKVLVLLIPKFRTDRLTGL